jgi:HEAT repeat protein
MSLLFSAVESLWTASLALLLALATGVTGVHEAARADHPLVALRTESLESLIMQLDSPVPAARALVACALRERGEAAASAIPRLVGLLDDGTPVDPLVCAEDERWRGVGDRHSTSPGQEAARALVAIGPAAFDPVLRALGDGGAYARRHAAWALGAMRDERAAPALIDALRDTEWHVRANAAWAIGALRDRRGGAALIDRLSDSQADVRRNAAWALGALREPAATEPLAAALRDSDAGVRRNAAWALGAVIRR